LHHHHSPFWRSPLMLGSRITQKPSVTDDRRASFPGSEASSQANLSIRITLWNEQKSEVGLKVLKPNIIPLFSPKRVGYFECSGL
jgi:hypothetical protein